MMNHYQVPRRMTNKNLKLKKVYMLLLKIQFLVPEEELGFDQEVVNSTIRLNGQRRLTVTA